MKKRKIADLVLYISGLLLCCSLSVVINQLISEKAVIVAAIVAPISFVIAIIAAYISTK